MRTNGAARAVDLQAVLNAADADVASGFHPLYRAALGRLPAGDQTFRGLPFRLGPREAGRRWLFLDHPVTVMLDDQGPVSHVVVAHFCDASHDGAGGRPAGIPLGWVVPAGEPLARYTIERLDGRRDERVIRRRFEVNEGILGWGQGAFAAVSHHADEPLDWRGPHPAQAAGRYAAAGHAGPLTVLPASWGADQTGVRDFVPSASDEGLIWLHAIEVADGPAPLSAIHLEPLPPLSPGRGVVIAAITLFIGRGDPLRLEARQALRVEASDRSARLSVDLGVVIRRRPAAAIPDREAWLGASIVGWGEPREPSDEPAPVAAIVDVSMARDAVVEIAGETVPAAGLVDGGRFRSAGGRVAIEALPRPDRRVAATIADGRAGPPLPARVRFISGDGRYLPPVGHRDQVNPGLYEDTGADLVLGASTWAYVPGSFEIMLPPGPVLVEAASGFEHRPVRTIVEVGPASAELTIPLERAIDTGTDGWVSADSHVHFLAPSTALLQARAEGVNLVHLLATQWGDHFTSVTDLPLGTLADPSGEHLVCLGTENRQNMLGHVGLVGARRPVLPMASGGPPEGRIGDPVAELIADWADRAHGSDGLAIAVHFPLPYAEVAADIVAGRIDAVEMQCFAPGLDSPSIAEWYRFLNCGYRVPVVGGTDKMSAEVPVGAMRTYARLAPGTPLTFASWAAAVRAGRTFASSGPVIELSVEGHEPGEVVVLPATGGGVEVEARVRASQPIVTALEVVANGRIVAAATAPSPTAELVLRETVRLDGSAWIAARSRSDHEIHSAFATSMAAHTSPVYVEAGGAPLFAPTDAEAILTIIEGTRTWIETVATVASEADRRRFADYLAAARVSLSGRSEREGHRP